MNKCKLYYQLFFTNIHITLTNAREGGDCFFLYSCLQFHVYLVILKLRLGENFLQRGSWEAFSRELLCAVFSLILILVSFFFFFCFLVLLSFKRKACGSWSVRKEERDVRASNVHHPLIVDLNLIRDYTIFICICTYLKTQNSKGTPKKDRSN